MAVTALNAKCLFVPNNKVIVYLGLLGLFGTTQKLNFTNFHYLKEGKLLFLSFANRFVGLLVILLYFERHQRL